MKKQETWEQLSFLTEYSKLTHFISNQDIIRVILDKAGGYGNEASTLNVMARLQALGFRGTFEFIYLWNNKEKVCALFNLSADIPSYYESTFRSHNKIILMQD